MAIHLSPDEVAKPQQVWLCSVCDDVFESDDELVPVYECSSCGTTFLREESADGDSNRCPNCNKFSALLYEHACPICGEECEPARGMEIGGVEWLIFDE